MTRKKRAAYVLAAALPIAAGVSIFALVDSGYRRFSESLYPELENSGTLQTGLMAEQIRGRLSSMDLLLLMLGGKAEAAGFGTERGTETFYRYAKNRAFLLTPLDRLYALNDAGEQLFSTGSTQETLGRAQRAAIADAHVKGLLSYYILSGNRGGRRFLAMSRRFDISGQRGPLILAAEISEESLLAGAGDSYSGELVRAALYDETGQICAEKLGAGAEPASRRYFENAYGEIFGMRAGGIVGGNKAAFRGKRLFTLVQIKDFSYRLAMEYDLSPKIDSLDRSRSMSLSAVIASTALVFILTASLLRLTFQKGRIRASAMRELEGMVANRTERLNEALAELEEIAAKDQLTGILNRRGMLEILNREFARANRTGAPFSVALGDIDHFKRVNDELGHEEGDSALRHVTESIAKRLRRSDALARWGGEEFLVYLPETSLEQALAVAEQVRKNVEETTWKEGIALTCSFGVASLRAGERLESLISRADEALYRAKVQRNAVSG